MTAFARESISTEQGLLTVELRSVNHRYLDCSFKLPEALRSMEGVFRDITTKRITRGKVECMMRFQNQSLQSASMHINTDRLQKLLSSVAIISESVPCAAPLNPLELLQFPGVMGAAEDSEELVKKNALPLFTAALESLLQSRLREGEKLATLITDRLAQVEQEVIDTRAILPQLMQYQRQRVVLRISELNISVDNDRLEQELVHLAQKADVDEELDRLDAHIVEVRRSLEKGGPCGRRLDFLMQELNREANTLSSKSLASSTTQKAVELKVLIEQMREQVQNIE